MTTILDGLEKTRRREVVKMAETAYKSGAEPSTVEMTGPRTRAERRQLARAMGIKGSKSVRRDPEKAMRRLGKRAQEIDRALMGDAALLLAQERVQHPLRSRLRRVG